MKLPYVTMMGIYGNQDGFPIIVTDLNPIKATQFGVFCFEFRVEDCGFGI